MLNLLIRHALQPRDVPLDRDAHVAPALVNGFAFRHVFEEGREKLDDAELGEARAGRTHRASIRASRFLPVGDGLRTHKKMGEGGKWKKQSTAKCGRPGTGGPNGCNAAMVHAPSVAGSVAA